MQWSKVKSILVFILVIVDAFLLFTLLRNYFVEYQKENEKNEHFVVVLSEKGISTGDDFYLPEMISLPMLEVDRSKNDEDSFTKGLLGDAMERMESADGNTSYNSMKGNIQWSVDGKISGYFLQDDYKFPDSEKEMRVATAKILEHCGIKSSIQIEVRLDENIAIASFETAGASVFNRYLQFTFDEKQIGIDGWWTFQTPYMVRTNNYVVCESADSILALLHEMPLIRRIDSVETGYVLSNSTGRRTSIVPCCRILTDRGEYFVDSLKNIVISQ